MSYVLHAQYQISKEAELGAREKRLQATQTEQEERAKSLQEMKERCTSAMKQLEVSEEASERSKTEVGPAIPSHHRKFPELPCSAKGIPPRGSGAEGGCQCGENEV